MSLKWSVLNTEQTVPSTEEIEIVLRNPNSKEDFFSYYIDVPITDFNSRWLDLLNQNLSADLHLEKNYCWLGWADGPRNAGYICDKINEAIAQINQFNQTGYWQSHGLDSYEIKDNFNDKLVIMPGNVGVDLPGLKLNHEPMNRLHRYFEDLQGETWNISKYYKLADYETKWAIRQLNDLCHELESWVLSNRKKVQAPEWQRPSQITTFLNAPRKNLKQQDYDLFLSNRYDREFGGVYLHWAQIGKTQFEVFRDEHGKDIDQATCSAISSLKFFSGEFDVEWGRDINENNHEWHAREQSEFREWLQRNGFNWNDPKLSLGYIKIGQINLDKSFGKMDFFNIIDKISKYLDIYKIKTSHTENIFDYVWSDPDYKNMQIEFLKPGYDWSKKNA
jgi:hypothetical protein